MDALIAELPLPLRILITSGLVMMPLLTLWSAARRGLVQARQMHQIPCHTCCYASGNPWLKCSLHPRQAFSEAALYCSDYESDPIQG